MAECIPILVHCSTFNHPTDENHDLSAVQTLRKLTRLQVAHKWRELGLELGVPVSELNIIQENNQGAVDPCRKNLADMFEWWIDNQEDASYAMVEDALWILKKKTFRRYGAAILVCMYMEHAAISGYNMIFKCHATMNVLRSYMYICIILIGLVLNGLHAAVHGYMHTISVVLVFVCKNRCIFIAGLLAMATLVTVFLFPFKSGNFAL